MLFKLVVNISAILLLIWIFLPAWEIIKVAFETTDAVYTPSILPDEVTLESFKAVVTQSFYYAEHFWVQMKNSLIVSFMTVILADIMALLVGYSLARINYRLKRPTATTAMLTYLFPQTLLGLPIYRLMYMYDLLNTHIGIILVITAFTTPFSIWIVWNYALAIPKEIDEAAIIDGATKVQLFTKIFVPLSLPVLVSISVYNFLVAWNDYLFSLLILQTESMYTLPLAIGYFFTSDAVEWNIFMAFGLLYSIPAFIFYLVFKRFLIEGLTKGAIKF
jgi:multiple sugar transport system permease protein